MSHALVVLSGGQDSVTCLFWAKRKYDKVSAITFDYGQRHHREIDAAIQVARMAGVETHEIMPFGDGVLRGRSFLTDKGAAVEEFEDFADMDQKNAFKENKLDSSFVPMRNVLFLTVAANRAYAWGCDAIVTGVCAADFAELDEITPEALEQLRKRTEQYHGEGQTAGSFNPPYPDCSPDFIFRMQQAIDQALLVPGVPRVKIETPVMYLTKAQAVKLAYEMPDCWAALAFSHTSYGGEYPPVGKNHANLLRAQGFEEAGLPDPLVLRAVREGLMELPATPNYDEERVRHA
jgi:7-cyano-7-deazaguanine synthase